MKKEYEYFKKRYVNMKKRFEFTLIELLITIAIIAILAGMLLPALNNARDKARAISCQNNLKTLGIALNQYTLNFNDYLIPYYNVPGVAPDSSKYSPFWVGVLCELPDPLTAKAKTRRSSYGVMWGEATNPHPPKGDFSCPAAEFGVSWQATTGSGNYKWSHYHLNHPLHGGWFKNEAAYQLPFYKITRIHSPTRAISLAERSSITGYASWSCFLHYEKADALNYERHDSKSGKGRCNVLYSDGHVGSLTRGAASAIKVNPKGNDNNIFRVGYNY